MRRQSQYPVFCGNCHELIEHCESDTGWMHEETRREACAGSKSVAIPEFPDGWYASGEGGWKR